MIETEYFFVYGTFMEGFYNYDRALKGHVTSRAPARLEGVALYHMERKGYPAMIPGEGAVQGELITLDDPEALLPLLDRIEDYRKGGADNEYDRRLTAVTNLDSGEQVTAYAYWYRRDDLNAPENPAQLLPGGDWRRFMEGRA